MVMAFDVIMFDSAVTSTVMYFFLAFFVLMVLVWAWKLVASLVVGG